MEQLTSDKDHTSIEILYTVADQLTITSYTMFFQQREPPSGPLTPAAVPNSSAHGGLDIKARKGGDKQEDEEMKE